MLLSSVIFHFVLFEALTSGRTQSHVCKMKCLFILLGISNCYGVVNFEQVGNFLYSNTDMGFKHIIVLDSVKEPCLEHFLCNQMYSNLLKSFNNPVRLMKMNSTDYHQQFRNHLVIALDNFRPYLEDLFAHLDEGDFDRNLWLFISQDTHSVMDACRSNKRLRFDSQVYVTDSSFQLYEVFRKSPNSTVIKQKVNMSKSIWERRNDLGELKLRAAYVPEYPWFYFEGKRLQGLDAQMFELLREDLNFSVEFNPSSVYGTYSQVNAFIFDIVKW